MINLLFIIYFIYFICDKFTLESVNSECGLLDPIRKFFFDRFFYNILFSGYNNRVVLN